MFKAVRRAKCLKTILDTSQKGHTSAWASKYQLQVAGQSVAQSAAKCPAVGNAPKVLEVRQAFRMLSTLGIARQHYNLVSNKLPREAGKLWKPYSTLSRWSSGWRPRNPEMAAVYGLLAANVGVFLLWRGDAHFAWRHFTTSWDAIQAGRIHTLVTSAFSQQDSMHLLANLIGLFFFGRSAAYVLGGRGLVYLYLAGGTFGNIVHVLGQVYKSRQGKYEYLNGGYYGRPVSTGVQALGASGAVNSIVMFDCLMAPTATVLIYGILPMPAFALGALYLFFDIRGAMGHGSSGIGYTVHLGGAAVGALAFLGVRRGRITTRWPRW